MCDGRPIFAALGIVVRQSNVMRGSALVLRDTIQDADRENGRFLDRLVQDVPDAVTLDEVSSTDPAPESGSQMVNRQMRRVVAWSQVEAVKRRLADHVKSKSFTDFVDGGIYVRF